MYVRGYVKKDGTYVAPHMRSAPGSGGVSAPAFVPSIAPAVRSEPRTEVRTAARSEARTSLTPQYSGPTAVSRAELVGRWKRVTRTVSFVNPPKLPAAFDTVGFANDEIVVDGDNQWLVTIEGVTPPLEMVIRDKTGVVVSRSLIQMKDGKLQIAVGGPDSFPADVAIGRGNALAVFSFERTR